MTRRIMVALDASAASHVALESAALLAAHFSAELYGLFIEDADIISAAGLPGSSIISYEGTHAEPLTIDTLMSSLKAQARRLREELERIANAHRVRWHFETVRGGVSQQILNAAASSEIIAMGFSSVRGRGVFGSTALRVLSEAPCSILMVRRALPSARAIVVMTAGSQQALDIGQALARMADAELSIQQTPQNRVAALDLLMRLAPTYLVIDRSSLAALDVSARELGEQLKVEGLIVTGGPSREETIRT